MITVAYLVVCGDCDEYDSATWGNTRLIVSPKAAGLRVGLDDFDKSLQPQQLIILLRPKDFIKH